MTKLLTLILAVTVLEGCASPPHTITLQIPANNRAALHFESGSPRVTVNNGGPAAVLVEFSAKNDTSKEVRVLGSNKVTRDIESPGKVVIQSDPEGDATVNCVVERCAGMTVEAAKPK